MQDTFPLQEQDSRMKGDARSSTIPNPSQEGVQGPLFHIGGTYFHDGVMDNPILKSMNSQEVNTLVSTSRKPPASGNRLLKNLENFQLRSRVNQIAKISELAPFWDAVILGRCFKTAQDVDDGFGGFTPACREYTHSGYDSEARVFAAILGGTPIGPVVGVRIALLHGDHGIEVEIPYP